MLDVASLRTQEPCALEIMVHPTINEVSMPKGTPHNSRSDVGDNAM